MTTFSNQLNAEIIYPYSDGKPMAESDPARDYLTYCVEALNIYYQNRTDVYVSGNLFIYYTQGEPSDVIAPDVFVVFGVRKKKRPSYKVWEENNKAPDFVVEITSESTQEEDETTKPSKYASLGVTEYFQYDPEAQYLNPNLKGFRLNLSNTYEPIQPDILPDGTFSIHSKILNLDLRLIYDELRFFDPQTENMLLSHQESEKARTGAVPKLLAMGLSVEQVALALSLPVEQVRRLIKE